MQLGILGTGQLGKTLGKLFLRAGLGVYFGSRDPNRSDQLEKEFGMKVQCGSYDDAIQASPIIILAIPWTAAKDILKNAGPWAGKILIDPTIPLRPGGDGLAVGHYESAAERIAYWARGARVVKAFNTVYYRNLENPDFQGTSANIFVCGDETASTAVVCRLAETLGFVPVNCGKLENARLLEPVSVLWIQAAFGFGAGTDTCISLLRKPACEEQISVYSPVVEMFGLQES